jgi:uncharacterized protein YcgL (UPF0745 family)
MYCIVYRSRKKSDAYLYVPRGADGDGDLSRVPSALRTLLGALEHALVLELTPERRLANADVTQVMRALDENGYYLQLPPEPKRHIQ